ncbi:MAG: hypothetical protein Q9172_004065 [Xanthocarpia lactea]
MSPYTSSTISTFITHLRLLDLDQLEDWPVATERLFAAKHARENRKQRIYCVEWALYRLFKIWDPKETVDKLQPFFPPYESLRSLNLRAALFRCLTGLKSDGMLGNGVVVRKTMFDDCRGDRFEELLASFSTIVLQKVFRTERNSATSIAGRLTTRQDMPRKEQGSLIPLAIAHQGGLRALLSRKERLNQRYIDLKNILEAKEQELLTRVDNLAQADAECPLEAVSDRAVQDIRYQLDENWQGDTQWVKSIVEADTRDSNDPLLDKPFSSLWSLAENGTIDDGGADAEQSLVQDLTQRVRFQQQRLSHWQNVQQGLFNCRPKSPTRIDRKSMSYPNRVLQSPLKFSFMEQYIQDRDNVKGPISPDMKIQHRQLLEHSHRKINPVITPSKKLEFKLPLRAWVDPFVAKPEGCSRAEPTHGSCQLEYTPSIAASPMEQSILVNDAAPQAEEKSTDLPKQLGNILHPPPDHATSILERVGNQLSRPRIHEQQSTKRCQASPTPLQEHIAGYGCIENYQRNSTSNLVSFPESPTRHEAVLAQQIFDVTVSGAPTVERQTSLMERTRQSMAFSRIDSLLPDPVTDPIPFIDQNVNQTNEHRLDGLGISSSLVEQTRRSMSLLPAALPSQSSRASIHDRRQSKQYPTNQFETPKKQLENLTELTPPDVLFSPGADYASVFKSRPKIATSPGLSPTLAGRLQWDDEKDGHS